MKNKKKIGIGIGLLALTITSAFATGNVDVGKLFAAPDNISTYTSSQTFAKGDMVMIGGKKFTVLDPDTGKLLAYENIGEETNYDYPAEGEAPARTEVADRLATWTTDMKGIRDGDFFQGNGELINFTDVSGVTNVGNGTAFWTATDGDLNKSKVILNTDGVSRKTAVWQAPETLAKDGYCQEGGNLYHDGVVQDVAEATCVRKYWAYNRIDANYRYLGRYYHSTGAYRDRTSGVSGPYATASATGTQRYASLREARWQGEVDVEPYKALVGKIGLLSAGPNYTTFSEGTVNEAGNLCNPDPAVSPYFCLADEKSKLIGVTVHEFGGGPGPEASSVRAADIADVRPSILSNLSSVLFTSANGTPVDAEPQTDPVTLTLMDNNIDFSMSDDQQKKISTTTSKEVKLKYDTTTTGENHKIKMIIKDNDGKIIKYETLEDVSAKASGEITFIPGSVEGSGLGLSEGNYTIQLFNELDNSTIDNTSNRASIPVEISLSLQRELKLDDISETGTKLTGTEFYDESGANYTFVNSTENNNIGTTYSFIRVGTLSELDNTTNPVAFSQTSIAYTNDGIYERKQVSEPYDKEKYPDGYDYSNCLFVQLSKDANGQSATTTMVALNSVKIDTRVPYFPSGKDGEEKPIKTENIVTEKPASNSIFSFFSNQPAEDINEEYAGEHVKVIPNAKDYGVNMFGQDNKLKEDAKANVDGIVSYKMLATVLDSDGNVDTTKTPKETTINVKDDKFIKKDTTYTADPDAPVNYTDAYFELKGKNAYWIQITAYDRAGREMLVDEKLILDATIPGKTTISAAQVDEEKTPYKGGEIENEVGELVDNWVGNDVDVTLDLSEKDKKDLKSGVDYYEYTTTKIITEWVNGGNNKEDLVWTSLGKKLDVENKPTKTAQNVFTTDTTSLSENEEYHYRAVSGAGIKGIENTFKIKKDKAEPKLDVVAYDMDTKTDYIEGAAAKKGIKFTLTPTDETTPVSGVKYYYRGVPSTWKPTTTTRSGEAVLPSDEEIKWIEVVKDKNNLYTILTTESFSGSYYFRGENGGHVTTAAAQIETEKVTVNVGVDQPKTPIKVSSKYKKDDSLYDGTWTKEDLTLHISGGLDGADTPAYYEYSTDPKSTQWTKVAKDTDGTFKVAISTADTLDASLYFRVIKDGDDDEIPLSTMTNGVRVRHDSVEPLIMETTFNPDKTKISSNYVTLNVKMTEKDLNELANASPIASYSIDGGTNWIIADSKNPRVFSYDFDKNNDNIILHVKDEAGNITIHSNVLVISNIDKTGPGAPTFTNGNDFKGGIWKNKAQDVKVSFTKAISGADEWIQYHIQKYVNGAYEELNIDDNSTGGELVWTNFASGVVDASIPLTQEGNYKVIVRSIDSMGRVSAQSTTTDTIRIDTTSPTISEITQVEDKWATTILRLLTNDMFFKDHIHYTFSGEDAINGSGLEKYQYQLTPSNEQPVDDKWVDAYKGEVDIEKDFIGDLHARSVDYAGNISTVVHFDGIQVDATLPTIEANPKDLSVHWTNTNTIEITAKDAGSGIKDSKVTYTSTYNGTQTPPQGDLILDGFGKGIISNLPNGDYSIEFSVVDKSDHSETLLYPVLIDMDVPNISIIDPLPNGIVSEKVVNVEVQNTIGGEKSLSVKKDGQEISGLAKSNKAPEVLTGNYISVYTLKVTSNGVYEVEVVGNTLQNGVNVRAKAALTVSNVFSAKPKLKIEAYTGNDENKDVYEAGSWTKENVEIVLSNTEPLIKTSDLTFQYRIVEGVGMNTTWTNIEDSETSSKSGRFSVYGNGQSNYEFRAVMLDEHGVAILVSDEISFVIAQDTSVLVPPVLVKPDLDSYSQLKWYDKAQILEVDFHANEQGLGQWVEYNLDGEVSGSAQLWKKAEWNTVSKKYEIRVKGDKQHKVKIRSNDAYNRFSTTQLAYVNIDTSTPYFDVATKYTSSNANLSLITVDELNNSTIGISGVEKATIQKKENGNLVPETLQVIWGNKISISKDTYGNGTYEVVLKTVSGKEVKKDNEVNGINLPKPIISVSGTAIDKDGGESAYISGTWVNTESVKLAVVVNNAASTGVVTYEYQEDGDSSWTKFANDGADSSMIVSGNGAHRMTIRSINASGVVSDIYHFDVLIDTSWDEIFVIQKGTTSYPSVDTPWYNKTQTITSTFVKDVLGCKEWIEYSEDGINWTHNSKNTYEVSTTGKHELYVRKNDEVGSGNKNSTNVQRAYVYIDKNPIKDFKVKIDEVSYNQWLSNITFGIYHNEAKQAIIEGDFGIAGVDKMFYQIVNQPSDYENVSAKWIEYTAPVDLANDFKGFIYAKAIDKAGNTSNIIRTDGIIIDTVAPGIVIGNNNGEWITQQEVQIDVSDLADGTNVGNASGITSISYETKEATPKEGTLEVTENKAIINDLHDGEYSLRVQGSDKAGNSSEVTSELKLDRVVPSMEIEGYKELNFTSVNQLKIVPKVGISGVKNIQVTATLLDGSSIDEPLTAPNYSYNITKNASYTFTLENNAGISTINVLEVTNITDDMNNIMSLDIMSKDLDGKEVVYRDSETLAGVEANPAWTAKDVILRGHGNVKFKASVDGGYYSDFNADGTFTINGEGQHIVQVKNDNDATLRNFVVKIDKFELKDLSVQDEDKYTVDKWFNSEQVIQANFLADDTGIDEWIEYYDLETASWQRNDSILLKQEGKHVLRIRGNDELNRPTIEKVLHVNIDKTPPSDLKIAIHKSAGPLQDIVNHLFPNTYDETLEVSIHANGVISENRKIEYQLVNEEAGESFNDKTGWKKYDTSFKVEDQFKGNIYARASDNAGNTSLTIVTKDGIIVDKQVPIILFQSVPMNAWNSENTIKVAITPTLSGLQKVWYTTSRVGDIDHEIALSDIDANGNVILKDMPNGQYKIHVYAKNKAGKTGQAEFDKAMIENRGARLEVKADLVKKAVSVEADVEVDMSGLYTSLTSLTWQLSDGTPQDILAAKKFTINNNGIYKVVATTSSGVVSEKVITVSNITSVASTLGVQAYETKSKTAYAGGNTWSNQDITLDIRDISGKVPTGELSVEAQIHELQTDGTSSIKQGWSLLATDAKDVDLFHIVATDEGSFIYEFRGTYQGVSGTSTLFNVNIDRSAPKAPIFSEAALTKFDNDTWHKDFSVDVEASITPTDGCDEWLQYNVDGQTDFEGNLLWTSTLNPQSDLIKVVDDKQHMVQIRTMDRLDRISTITSLAVKLDSTRPTDFYIKAGVNKYQDFLDIITGGIFYNGSETIEIGGNFEQSGIQKIEYQIVKQGETFNPNDTWKHVNVKSGETSGNFQLLSGTTGVIYARGVDKAGNETGTIRSDLITIDNTAPILRVPEDATTWSNKTTMNIEVMDELAGIQSVTYKILDPQVSGTVSLSDNVDGEGYRTGVISNLPDGNYLVEVIATDKAGVTQTKLPRVMIDTRKPTLDVEGQSAKPLAKVTLDLVPHVGGSKLKEIQEVDVDGNVLHIVEAVTGQSKYPYEFIANGDYYFKVVNNAGVESDIVKVVIGNIEQAEPQIIFRADNGYVEGTWSGQAVVLETSTNTNAQLSYRKKGEETFSNAANVYYQDLKFDKTGTYTYEFKSVYNDTGKETMKEYTIKVDLQAPKKASVKDASEYGKDVWYQTSKDVTLIRDTSDYTNSDGSTTTYGEGSIESTYYMVEGVNDGDGNPIWNAMNSDTITINRVGSNIVIFKVVDEISSHVTRSERVVVNIFTDAPNITLTTIAKPVKSFEMDITIGNTQADDQVKKLSVERLGGEEEQLVVEQGKLNYKYPVSKNGTYIVRVEMENGGKAEKQIVITNIIENDPILDVKATWDNAGVDDSYTFGTWVSNDVTIHASDTSGQNATIQIREKNGSTWSAWSAFQGTQVIQTDGERAYQFKTILTKDNDTYETIMDETFRVKVDKNAPAEVIIDQQDLYDDPTKWTSKQVNLTTTFTPDLTGAKEWVEYSTDGGTTWVKKNSLLVKEAGAHTISFRSADETNRVSAQKTVYVNIDNAQPANFSMQIGNDPEINSAPNNITFTKFYQPSEQVSLKLMKNETEEDSVGKKYYQFADLHNAYIEGAWIEYTGVFNLPDNFKGSIYAYGENQSGKKSEIIRSNGIVVDSQAPILTLPADMTLWNKSSNYKVNILDSLAGVDETTSTYAFYASDVAQTPTSPAQQITLRDGKGVISLPDGEYYVEINASDNAGNAASAVRRKVMIDANKTDFMLTSQTNSDHAVITATIPTPPISGISGIYIRSEGSSWQLLGNSSPATFNAYKNGVYEVKVTNGARKDSDIKTITISNVTNNMPTFDLKKTDGYEFGNFWYQPLTLEVISDAKEIYYSLNGANGPWIAYNDKIEIKETSAYQFTFKVKNDNGEFISLPYDTRVIVTTLDKPSVQSELPSPARFMRSVFSAFTSEVEEWKTTGTMIHFDNENVPEAPGYKIGLYFQLLNADANGNAIGYDEDNFEMLDPDDPTYIFESDGRYVIYSYSSYYVEGDEENWAKPNPDSILIKKFNIDGTDPDELKLSAEVDGLTTILNILTGGLFFKEPITITPLGHDALSGIKQYEFQKAECTKNACNGMVASNGDWEVSDTYHIEKDFEGIVFAKAVDKAGNKIERSVKLAIKEDITTYKIKEDISKWSNTTNLTIEVSPSTNGVQEVKYAMYSDPNQVSTPIALNATDTEKTLYEISDVLEGEYFLKVIPVETGGLEINSGVHTLKIDRTKPVVAMKLEQKNVSGGAKFMNAITLQQFFKPGLEVSASATDKAGTLDIDPSLVTIEYKVSGGEWTTYSSAIHFDEDEIIDIAIRAKDQAGNYSDIVTQDRVTIDGSGPIIKGASNNTSYWLPRTITISDETSGVDTVFLNEAKTTSISSFLVKETGLAKIEAIDKSTNASSIAFTIKGLDNIKDGDINDDLIDEIEKEFEEQKPGYDDALAKEIQDKIDDLKDRNPNKEPDNPDNPGGNPDNPGGNPDNPGGNPDNPGGNPDNPGGNPDNPGGNPDNPGGNPDNPGGNTNKPSGNGSSNGNNSNTSSVKGNYTGSVGGVNQSTKDVTTGDTTSSIAYMVLGICSILLTITLHLKQKINHS